MTTSFANAPIRSHRENATRVVISLMGLACGVLTGTILAIVLTWGPQNAFRWAGVFFEGFYRVATHTPMQAAISEIDRNLVPELALVWSAGTAVVAVPIWLILGKYGRNGILSAITLGLLLGVAADAVFQSLTLAGFHDIAKYDVVANCWFGLVGASAAAVTWLVSHLHSHTA